MEKKLYSTDFFGCKNCKANEATVPVCINDDYCLASPIPRNNGILAMAFVDMQPIEKVYPESTAFYKGTLFENLDMPFLGGNKK